MDSKTTFVIWLLAFGWFSSVAQLPSVLSIEDTTFSNYFANKSNCAVITGKLSNISSTELSKLQIDYTLDVPMGVPLSQVHRIAAFLPDGTFRLELGDPFPNQEIWLSIDKFFYAGIYANEALDLQLDFVKLKAKPVEFFGDGVEFKGKDSALNSFLNKARLFKLDERRKLQAKSDVLNSGEVLTDRDWLRNLVAFFARYEKLDDEFLKDNPSPYGFILENERQSELYKRVMWHYWRRSMGDSLWHVIQRHKTYLVSNSACAFYQSLKDYLVLRPPYLWYPDWIQLSETNDLKEYDQTLIKSIIEEDEKKRKGLEFDSVRLAKQIGIAKGRFSTQLDLIRKRKLALRFDDELSQPKADLLKLYLIDEADPILMKELEEFLSLNMKTTWCKQWIQLRHKGTLEQIASINNALHASVVAPRALFGKPLSKTSFGAKLYLVDSLGAKELLGNLISSFPGKALIIDIWATWCAPCIAEMPHTKSLSQRLSSEEVEFVYLCTNNETSQEKWKGRIALQRQPGTHIFCSERIVYEIMSLFGLHGYPSHIYLDKKGNYVSRALDTYGSMSVSDLEAIITRE